MANNYNKYVICYLILTYLYLILTVNVKPRYLYKIVFNFGLCFTLRIVKYLCGWKITIRPSEIQWNPLTAIILVHYKVNFN